MKKLVPGFDALVDNFLQDAADKLHKQTEAFDRARLSSAQAQVVLTEDVFPVVVRARELINGTTRLELDGRSYVLSSRQWTDVLRASTRESRANAGLRGLGP